MPFGEPALPTESPVRLHVRRLAGQATVIITPMTDRTVIGGPVTVVISAE